MSISGSTTSPSDPNTSTGSALQGTTAPQHRYEGARRFHDGDKIPYILPNDVEEDDRIHMQHWALKLAFGSNFDAPVEQALEEGINVLDSACGPATWALEMANMFKNSNFFGTDISARFPDQIKPGNCEFRVHNIVDEPPFEENYFGYIHQRLVILAIKAADWPTVLKNLKYTLRPEGWLELTEFSYFKFQNLGPCGQFYIDLCIKITTSTGLDPDITSHLPDLLIEAGYTNVQSRPIDVPINHSGKVGELIWEDFRIAFISVRPMFAKAHSEFEDPSVYEKFIDELGEEFKNNKSILQWTRILAQKPSTNSS